MTTDLIDMIGNLSRNLFSVQHLLYGLSYVLGLVFFFKAFQKFGEVAQRGRQVAKNFLVPTAYLFGGATLLFMPSMSEALANTFFGASNILQYAVYNPYDIYSSMSVVIKTAGIIWFLRGSVLLTHASEGHGNEGKKGLMFLVAGIFSMNFDTSVAYISTVMAKLAAYTMSFKGQS